MGATSETFVFQTPNSPQEFGVVLPPASLRRLNFSALDYNMMMRAAVEYVKTYHPNEFNDFFASNGFVMMVELMAYMSNILSERADILIDEAYLSTAQTKEAVTQHLSLINQEIQRATPATVDVEISLTNPLVSELRVPAGLRFQFQGPDGKPVYYEVFRAPGDFTSDISIPAGKRGIIAYGIEGASTGSINVISAGGSGQYIDITDQNLLDDPIFVTVQSTKWQRVQVIEKSGPNDEVYEVRNLGDKTRIVFGDDKNGKAPLAGFSISVTYRVGGGIRGQIGANILNTTKSINPQPPATAAVEVSFRNPAPSQGGTDAESIDDAKRRAPREFATHNAAITGSDYGLLASNYNHPVYGTVAKALGTIRTGVNSNFYDLADQIRKAATIDAAVDIMKDKFINTNYVEIYVLAYGPNNTLVKPSSGLKQGLISYFSDINVLTDEVVILDGEVKNVDVQAFIIMDKNADAGTVKSNVYDAINKFFDLRNFDMGTPLYLSSLYNVLQVIPGVKYVNIFQPMDDITNIKQTSSSTKSTVDFNEVIVLGNVDIKFYFEQGSSKGLIG